MVPLIWCSEGVTKLLAAETETCIIATAKEPPSPMICYDEEIHPKTNMEPRWNNTGEFLGTDEQSFPKPLCAHRNSAKNAWTTHKFQEEEAADGTSSAPLDPNRSNRQFPFSKTSQIQ